MRTRTFELDDIIALWRETLAPEAARAATNAARALPHAKWSNAPKTLHAEWLKRGKKPDDEMIVELVRVSDFAKHTASQLLQRLELMATWKPHPLATRWLVDVFARQTRAPQLSGQECFRRVFDLLVEHVDISGAAQLEAWIGNHAERIAASASAGKFFDAGMRRVLEKSAKRRTDARAPTEAELASLEKSGFLVEPTVSADVVTVESLHAAIYESPWDDGPRLVLADMLQQQGDPRGELIALDLLPSPTPDQIERRAELLKQHGKAWFPDALNRMIKKGAEYERGFLAYGELTTVKRTTIELATFRELRGTSYGVPRFDHPAYRGVESWLGIEIPAYGSRPKQWLEHPPMPHVRRLGVKMRPDLIKPEDLLALIRPDAWPSVTEIVVDIDLVDSLEYGHPELPGLYAQLPTILGAHLPQVQYVDVRPFARFDRDGRITTDVFVPRIIVRDLNSDPVHEYQAENRRRWRDWLRGLGRVVVIDIEKQSVSRLGERLGVEVRKGKPHPLARLGATRR